MNLWMRRKKRHQKYSLMIGRWQPLHAGHISLIQSVLDEGKPVCVAIRETPISETDPYDIHSRWQMITKAFHDEYKSGRLKVIAIPDISEVAYGRDVGYGIREIHLDPSTEAISGTRIRNEKNKA